MQERRQGKERRSNLRRRSDQAGINAYSSAASGKKNDDLVTKHLKLVSYVVSRLAIGMPSWIDRRDLISAGVVGLIDAAKHFDPAKGVKFETYASSRIRGAIIDELRALDWIPRSTREKSKAIEEAISGLVGKLGRFPTDQEVAQSLGWEMKKYYKAIEQVSGTTLLSLDEIIPMSGSGDSVKRIDTVSGRDASPLSSIENREMLDNLVKVIGGLSEQERLVIALYYYEELTLKEIGIVLKVSESRVSQIHTTAILKIRARLKAIYFEP